MVGMQSVRCHASHSWTCNPVGHCGRCETGVAWCYSVQQRDHTASNFSASTTAVPTSNDNDKQINVWFMTTAAKPPQLSAVIDELVWWHHYLDKWTVSVTNWLLTVESIIKLVRLTMIKFITLTTHLYWAESTCCEDLHAMAKFSNFRVWGKVPKTSTLIFGDSQIFLQYRVRYVEGCLYTKNKLINQPTPHHSIVMDRMIILTPNQQCQSTKRYKENT